MFHGGHDYCMTCYVRIIDEERRRKLDEKRRKDEQEFAKKKVEEEFARREQEAKRRREREEKERREEIKHQAQEMIMQQKRIAGAKDVGRHKHHWDVTILSPPPVIEAHDEPELRKLQRKQIATPAQQTQTRMPTRAAAPERAEKKPPSKKREMIKAQANVALTVVAGLPVSLSVGQKGIRTMFACRNGSQKRLTLEFAVSIEDAKKKKIEPKLEPKQCSLEPDAEAQLTATFDLQDDANTGPLTLTAQMKENAIYVDRESAKSEPLVFTSQVKTPMELVYLPGSAEFGEEDGTSFLSLAFENVGESGGFLLPRSSTGYGTGGKMLRTNLPAKVKIKGKQKRVELRFSPAQERKIEFLVFDLCGTDSNGKEFKLQKSLNLKADKE